MAAVQSDIVETNQTSQIEVLDMEDETKVEPQDKLSALDAKMAGLSAAVDTLLNKLETSKNVGYLADRDIISPDGGTEKPQAKGLADFLMSIKRRDYKRLKSVYAVKDMSGETAVDGGVLAPPEISTQLLSLEGMGSQIVPLVTRQTVSARAGQYPALDQYLTPVAGSGETPYAAGVDPAITAEGAAYPEQSDPKFTFLDYTIRKIGDVVDVPIELIDDSGQSIQNLLTNLFRVAIDARLERDILRGSGAGEFLGILNADATIGQTAASDGTFSETDALAMLSKFRPINRNNVAWIMHRSVIPDLASFTASDRDVVEWRGGVSTTLLGYPIIYSDHLPQANNSGDVVLADLSAYILFDRQQLVIDYNPYGGFKNDLVTWRFKIRADGMPWVKNKITLPDPQGSFYVSPFIKHVD